MNKLKIKEHLLQLIKESIAEEDGEYNALEANINIDTTDIVDEDDESRHFAGDEILDGLNSHITNCQNLYTIVEKLDFAPTKDVGPGAIVKINNLNLIIAVAYPHFNFNNGKYLGVSTNAPLFNCIKGKKAGESFVFNNKSFVIDEVQ